MRIGTISYTTIDNYGAILQAYALAKLLEQRNHQVNIIDYQLPDLKLRDWLHIMHLSYVPHAPYTVFAGVPELAFRFSRIEQFRKKYLQRTQPVWSDAELRETAGQFDTLITGSDEIFRNDRQGNVFAPLFLNFANARQHHLHAYAACSGGVTDFGNKNAIIAKLLNRFESLSVRDDLTRTLVKKLTGTDPQLVLDPTLLWNFNELPLPAPPAENYILTYGFFRSPQTDRMVREVADKMGVSVVSVGWASKYAHHNFMAADILQWLSCFKHARLVFTNCYHGLMFATQYQRDFLVFESEKARAKLNDFIYRFSLAPRLLPSGKKPSAQQLAGMDHAALQASLTPYACDSLRFIGQIAQPPAHQQPSPPADEGLESWEINGTRSPSQPGNARQQLNAVGLHMAHFLWETLFSALTCPPLRMQVKQHWQATVAGSLWFVAVLWLHISSDSHLAFLPLYLLPCAWLATKVNLRLGVIACLMAAVGGALVQHYSDPDFKSWLVVAWNVVMRFMTLHIIVSLLGRLYQKKAPPTPGLPPAQNGLLAGLLHHWAVILTSGLLFAAVAFVQAHASPHLMFIPLYLVPCLMATLGAGWGWGSIMAFLCAVAGPQVQSFHDPDYQPPSLMIWNMVMRFIIFQTVVLLLNFTPANRRRGSNPPLPTA